MKKLAIIMCSVALAVVVCFGATGCKKKKNIKSSNSVAGVVSNGGIVAQKDNMLYFVAGTEDSTNTNSNITKSAIWKATISDDGTLSGASVFVSSIVGFEFGSIHIFGDYLYYATPSVAKDSDGYTLSGILDFWRKPLSGGSAQKVYSTSSDEETDYVYAYYPVGNKDLYLVVYEKTAKTLVSVDVGSHSKAKKIATDVTGVVMSENGATDGANKYVFYTHAKDKNDNNQNGNVVERILPNGSQKTTISADNKTYSLLSIRNGKLLFAENNVIYQTSGEQKLDSGCVVVSMLATSAYSDVILFADHIIAKDKNKNLIYVSWGESGEVLEEYRIAKDTDATLLCATDDKLFYTESSVLYSIEIGKDKTALKICEQKAEKADGNIAPEIVGNFLYFMGKEDEDVCLFRVDITKTELQTAEKLAK